MKYEFLFSDLVLFLRIIGDDVEIKLPDYILRIESYICEKYNQMFEADLRWKGQLEI